MTVPTRPTGTPQGLTTPVTAGVGASPLRPDGTPKVRGEFAYGSDMWTDGMIWGVTLRSPHPYARIRSIDIGPAYLGSGKLAPTRVGAKRDLRKVLRAARRLDIPLIVGSAGSAGARPHLDQTLEIIREIAHEDGLAFRLGVVAFFLGLGVRYFRNTESTFADMI